MKKTEIVCYQNENQTQKELKPDYLDSEIIKNELYSE